MECCRLDLRLTFENNQQNFANNVHLLSTRTASAFEI